MSFYDAVLKSGENLRLPPPNILCICDNCTKVCHDVLLFHHFHAPPFPLHFAFKMISMFYSIISIVTLLREDVQEEYLNFTAYSQNI